MELCPLWISEEFGPLSLKVNEKLIALYGLRAGSVCPSTPWKPVGWGNGKQAGQGKPGKGGILQAGGWQSLHHDWASPQQLTLDLMVRENPKFTGEWLTVPPAGSQTHRGLTPSSRIPNSHHWLSLQQDPRLSPTVQHSVTVPGPGLLIWRTLAAEGHGLFWIVAQPLILLVITFSTIRPFFSPLFFIQELCHLWLFLSCFTASTYYLPHVGSCNPCDLFCICQFCWLLRNFFSPFPGFLVVSAENYFCTEPFPTGVFGGRVGEQHLHFTLNFEAMILYSERPATATNQTLFPTRLALKKSTPTSCSRILLSHQASEAVLEKGENISRCCSVMSPCPRLGLGPGPAQGSSSSQDLQSPKGSPRAHPHWRTAKLWGSF